MKRRSFMQAAIAAISGLFVPAAAAKDPFGSRGVIRATFVPKAAVLNEEWMAGVETGFPWALMHNPGCGGIAFRLTEQPKPGDRLHSSIVASADFLHIPAGSPMVCTTCLRHLGGSTLRSENVQRLA